MEEKPVTQEAAVLMGQLPRDASNWCLGEPRRGIQSLVVGVVAAVIVIMVRVRVRVLVLVVYHY